MSKIYPVFIFASFGCLCWEKNQFQSVQMDYEVFRFFMSLSHAVITVLIQPQETFCTLSYFFLLKGFSLVSLQPLSQQLQTEQRWCMTEMMRIDPFIVFFCGIWLRFPSFTHTHRGVQHWIFSVKHSYVSTRVLHQGL